MKEHKNFYNLKGDFKMEELNNIETIEEVNVEATENKVSTETNDGMAGALLIGLTAFAAVGVVATIRLANNKLVKPLKSKWQNSKKVKTDAVDQDGNHVDAEVVDNEEFVDAED